MRKKLSVNIDHVASLRKSRKTSYPNVLEAAYVCQNAGADQITFHLREDRRHIQDDDVFLLKNKLDLPINFEMAANDEMFKIACKINPAVVTLVPENRQELTTEGGLDVKSQFGFLRQYIENLHQKDIAVHLFVEPNLEQIELSDKLGCDAIEIHTGQYSNLFEKKKHSKVLEEIKLACTYASERQMNVYAGHGLYYDSLLPLIQVPEISGFSIGHGIVARSIFIGLDKAVKEMLNVM